MRGDDVTPAADVFSWGCVVAYAGTGRAPFGGGTLPETINRVTTAEPDLDGLDPAVRGLVARSLAKDPAERPTVKQLIQALTGEDAPPAGGPVAETPATVPLPPPEGRTTVDSVPPTHPAGAPPTFPPPAPSPAAMPSSPLKGRRRPHRDHGLLIGAMAAVVGIAALVGLTNLPDGDGKPENSGGTTAAADLGERPPDVKDKIFDDKFSDEESGWPRSVDGAYRDRSYLIWLVPSMDHTTAAAPVRSLPDSQLMEVKVQLGGPDAEAGVFCRSAEGTGYAFLIRGSGQARIVWMAPDKLENLHTGFVTSLRKDRDNRVQAACVPDDSGMRLGLWVNGEAVANTTDHEHADHLGTPGKSGLIVARAGDPSVEQQAVFDNFSLCSV